MLLAIIFSLLLVFLTGVRMYGYALPIPFNPDGVVFIAVILFSAIHIRAVYVAERESRKTQSLTLNLENANIKLTQLDTLKSEFLSFASHQIKAPMTVMKGYAQLILDGSFGLANDELRGVVEKIRASSDRMIKLVDTFLDLRRIDEGRVEYHMEPLELGGLTAAIVDELQQLADKKHLKLTLLPLPHAWRVSADAQHLRQVIVNLVDNAIKYTDDGSVTIEITDGEHKGTVLLRVTDTGRGISRELAPKLFEQFSRDQFVSKEIAGTGLGLYIARRIIEAHKGRIWATSPGPGKGSSFSIELPAL